MLYKCFLPVITGWLSRKNKSIINICYSTLNNNSCVNRSKEAEYINTETAMKMEEIEKIESEEKEKLKVSKKKGHKSKTQSVHDTEKFNIINHVSNINPNIISTCPKPFLKATRSKTNVLYLIDENVAAKFVSMIIDDLSKNMCFVAEMNPGFGILTRELLKAGVPLIYLYEAKTELHSVLSKLNDLYPGRLNLRHFNLIKISQLLYIDRKTDGKQIEEVLQAVETKKWEDETCMQIIGATGTSNFFRHLIYSLLFQNCLMSRGRSVFYIAIPPSLWHKYTCDNSDYNLYTTQKVMFQILFNYKHLGILDRKAFLPWQKLRKKLKVKSRSYQVESMDDEQIYVIKLEPKADIYLKLSQEDWMIFWYFLRHNMRKRKNRVIPELEKWIPGCGIRLIAKDYTIFTQFGDLTPEKLMELFKEFKSWPEYKNCNFLISMRNTLNMFNEPILLEFDGMHDDE